MDKYLIAHDLGTSGNKAILFKTTGEMIKSAVKAYDVNFFNGNWAEQSPHDWWNAICEATKELVRDIDAHEIAAVSFSGQMMGCLCVDRDGIPLRNSIIWADMRAEKEEEELVKKLSAEKVYKITGHRLSRSYSIEKLMWIKNNEPEIYANTYLMLQAKDYIVYRLTGNFMTDFSDASGTNALDLTTMQWSDEIIEAAGVDKSMLPEIRQSTHIAGAVTKNAAKECGLAEGTAVVLGGGDGSCASVGAGSIAEGITYNCLGSSSWISTVAKKPYFDEQMRTVTWAHVIPGLLIPSGTMQTAGAAFSWVIDRLCGEDKLMAQQEGTSVYDRVNGYLAEAQVGSNALLFLPYLLGERCPRWNSDARGSFVGLKMEHTKGDMLRSVQEGVAMNLNVILEILKNAVKIDEMIVVGGLAMGEENRKILADVFGMDVIRLKHLEEATSIGAAVIAGVGCGALDGFERVSLFNGYDEKNSPSKGNVDTYNRIKPIFERAYGAQCGVFEELAKLGK